MSNADWYCYHVPQRLTGLTPERIAADSVAAEQDLDAVLERTELAPGARILEVGCGWGRHALALARRGFTQVCSIDIAPEPLAIATALASERGLYCDFQLQDFRQVCDRPFDAILSLYDRSVCGFPTEVEDALSLRQLASLLPTGGWLVFGINDWPFYLPEPRRDWRETPDGIELIEVLSDRAAMTCTDRTTLIGPDGRRACYELTRRHYTLPELVRLLADAGFTITATLHRLDGRPYGTGENGLFVYARKERYDPPATLVPYCRRGAGPDHLRGSPGLRDAHHGGLPAATVGRVLVCRRHSVLGSRPAPHQPPDC